MLKSVRKFKEETKMARPMPKPYVVAVEKTDYAHQAYMILKFGFTVAPVIAGLDKFSNLLVDWTQYLTPLVPRWTGIDPAGFMMAVGVIEIVAGILVAMKPKLGALIVTAWLWGIIINLLLVPGYFDVALRDLGLSLGALALARLAEREE
jgi:uncharacterized membrane protein YphA (DoxX/SURF4 family)